MTTRGLGKGTPGNQGLVTGGFGKRLLVEIQRIYRAGQSGTKRALERLQEVLVWAKLIRVNDSPPPVKIQGFVKAHVERSPTYRKITVQPISARVRDISQDIKISVKRIKLR